MQIKGLGTVKHDVIVAADGIKSGIRAKMMARRGEIDETIPTGEAAYREFSWRFSLLCAERD